MEEIIYIYIYAYNYYYIFWRVTCFCVFPHVLFHCLFCVGFVCARHIYLVQMCLSDRQTWSGHDFHWLPTATHQHSSTAVHSYAILFSRVRSFKIFQWCYKYSKPYMMINTSTIFKNQPLDANYFHCFDHSRADPFLSFLGIRSTPHPNGSATPMASTRPGAIGGLHEGATWHSGLGNPLGNHGLLGNFHIIGTI